jgi:hypothetical protein
MSFLVPLSLPRLPTTCAAIDDGRTTTIPVVRAWDDDDGGRRVSNNIIAAIVIADVVVILQGRRTNRFYDDDDDDDDDGRMTKSSPISLDATSPFPTSRPAPGCWAVGRSYFVSEGWGGLLLMTGPI